MSPPSASDPASSPPRRWQLAFGIGCRMVIRTVVVLGAIFNVLRAVPGGPQMWGVPIWYLTYDHGLIRRGLPGTVFRFFGDGLDPSTVRQIILVFHVIA